MTTLDKVYCVPRTVEEWDLLYPNANWQGKYPCEHSHVFWRDAGKYLASWPNDDQTKTELPVPRFLDLLNDQIVPWRLEEVGFQNPFGDTYTLRLEHDWGGMIVVRVIRVIGGNVSINGGDTSITTFTDLLQLIRMLTP